MTTDRAANLVQLQIGDVSQWASPATLGLATRTDDSGLQVNPARVRTARVALDSTSNALQVRIAPDDATSPTWAHTKMAMTEASVGIGIGYPQGSAKLQVLGDDRIYGRLSANHPVLAPGASVSAQTNLACTAQPPHQQLITVISRHSPYSDDVMAEGIRADGTVSPPLHWKSGTGDICAHAHRLVKARSASLRKRAHSTSK